jgi:hypothetical protein
MSIVFSDFVMTTTLKERTSASLTPYEKDIIAWSKEQARLLPAG